MKNRHYLFVISFCMAGIFSSYCKAQKPLTTIDSLKVLLSQSKDTVKANLYNQIGWQFRNANPDSSYHYSKKGSDLSKALNYSSGHSHGLNYMGIAMRNQSKYYEAMQLFFQALNVAEEALDVSQISYSLVNIGNIYLYQNNFDGAFQYFNRSLKKALELNDVRLAAYCHINIGRSYNGMKEYEKAKSHVVAALEIRKGIVDVEGIAVANLELADIYYGQNDLKNSLQIINENLENASLLGDQSTLAHSYITVSKILFKQNKSISALDSIQKCLKICKINKLKNAEVHALKVLSEIYEQQDQPKKALAALKLHLSNKDSIFNAESTQKIADLFSKYTYEKSELEKSSLLAQTELNEMIIRRQGVIIILSVATTLAFIIIAFITYRSSMERKRLNDEIQLQKDTAFRHNNELIDINNEKNNLIRILSHDLRAPISNIKGLTQVHQMDHQFSESENQVLNLIKSESDRLLNMIKKILNVEAMDRETTDVTYEKVEFNSVTKKLVAGFQNAAQSKEIEITTTYLEEPAYILGDEIHLHQVMENLLSNAIKFSENRKKITIGLSQKNRRIMACFTDEGPGLTADDEDKIFKKFQKLSAKPTGDEESTGLGLSIVNKYVHEMNGKVWYESQLGKGTSFYVEFDQVDPPA